MSQGLVERQNLEDIADAIRSKNGSTDTYTPAEMAQAISGIHTADEVVLVQKTVNANGQYNASDDSADGYSGVRVNVPNTYGSGDEGKVVSNGALVAQTSKNINANGTYNTTTNNQVVIDVPSSGDSIQGFELYAIDCAGSSRSHKGEHNNNYFVCYFDDNMSNTYVLNGASQNFIVAQGAKASGQIHASTKAVTGNTEERQYAFIPKKGSAFSCQHGDYGSYVSIIGGWVGYNGGGTIYENTGNGTVNSITMNSTHKQLLVFVAATGTSLSNVNEVSINGNNYDVINNGSIYDGVYGIFGVFVIDNNNETEIAVTFPSSCANYLSIIGIG